VILNYTIVSSFTRKFADVYLLYGLGLRSSASIGRNLMGFRPDWACDVRRIGRRGASFMLRSVLYHLHSDEVMCPLALLPRSQWEHSLPL